MSDDIRPAALREAADKLTIRDATPLWDRVNNVLLAYGLFNPASSVPQTERVFDLFREHLRELAGTSEDPLSSVTDPEIPALHDPAALHAMVVRGLRAIGLNAEDAAKWGAQHRQDALDRAGDAIDDEAWPHEKPECENQDLYRLANKVRNICWCGQEKQPGENHGMCYPGME